MLIIAPRGQHTSNTGEMWSRIANQGFCQGCLLLMSISEPTLNLVDNINWIGKRNMQQFKRFCWVTVHIWKSVNWNTFIRPSSMDFTWLGRGAAIGPPTTNQNGFFPTKGLYYRQKYSCFISCPSGWSQTIPQVKKPDVEFLGWRGYT